VATAADVQDSSLHRDRVTALGYAVVAVWGWFIYALGPSIPLLRDDLGTSSAVAGLHSVALAGGGVVGGLAAMRVIGRFGRDGGMRRGLACIAVGAAGIVVGSLPGIGLLAVTLLSAAVAGVGGSLAINSSTAVLSDHHGVGGPAAVSESNATGSIVGLVAPVVVGATVATSLTWRAGLATAVPLAAVVIVAAVRTPHVGAFEAVRRDRGRASLRHFDRRYWLLWGALICAVIVEFAFVTWTSDLLVARTGLGVGAASTWTAGFLGGMAVSRLAVGRLSLRLPPATLFLACLVVAAIGWAVLWVATAPTLAVTGLLIAGLGAGGHFPLGVSLLIGASDGEADLGLAVLAVGLGSAGGLGPFALGVVADASSIHTAFLIIPATLVVAILLTVAGIPGRRSRGS
jgi:fucose permease